MGKAKIDLPDPLNHPPAASTVGADDLLAQLAGQELRRVLSEPPPMMAPAPAAPPALAATALPPPEESATILAAELNALFAEVGGQEVAPAASAAPASVPSANASPVNGPPPRPQLPQAEAARSGVYVMARPRPLPRPAPPPVRAGGFGRLALAVVLVATGALICLLFLLHR